MALRIRSLVTTPARRTSWLVLCACLAGPLTVSARADKATFESAWEALSADAARDYATLATWCHKGKLFGARNAAYDLVLRFAPDDVEARRRLQYRKAPDGTWTRHRYKPPRNLRSAGSAYETRRAAMGKALVERGLALLAEHASSVLPPRRQAVLRILVYLAPEREDVRAALGEQRSADGTWRLAESLGARKRRDDLRKLATAVLRDLSAPSLSRPTRAENALHLDWTAIVQMPHARLLGTVPREEVIEGGKRFAACGPVFRGALGGTPRKITPLAIYVLASPADRTTLLASHPQAPDSYRTWAARLQSSWFPKTRDVWIQTAEKDLRLEWVSRQGMGTLLSSQLGLRGKPGWAFEGFGLYLSHLVAGQRQTFFVKRTKYGEKVTRKDDLWARLRDKRTDWRAEARTLLASPRAPDLRLLLGKRLSEMNTEDMLVSYVLAALLLEGRPKEVAGLLTKIGRGKRPSVDVLSAAGLDPETLGIKLRRWLDET